MTATELLTWGIVAHLVCDWLLQNEWMAVNKMKRGKPGPLSDPLALETVPWWHRHPAAYVHAGIHGIGLAFVFGWVAILLALSHLLIDCRWIVAAWSKLIRQTQPDPTEFPLMDIGADVRIWADQVWHIGAIAIAALIVSSA